MPVYVDPMRKTLQSRRWKYPTACHMFADTSDELDEMARAIGLRPEWKIGAGTPSEHFDLTDAKRALAVANGAVEVEFWEAVAIWDRKLEAVRQ